MVGELLMQEHVRDVVIGALSDFAKRDMELLHVGVQEETISHRVAVYIEHRLIGTDWQVDCEYNRDRLDPKMTGNGGSRMRPDIIAHVRNSPRNLLVVEIKKTTHNKRQISGAKDRVRAFTGKWTSHPRYCHGVVLTFPVRHSDPKSVVCDWFHRDGSGAISGGEPERLTVPLIGHDLSEPQCRIGPVMSGRREGFVPSLDAAQRGAGHGG